MFKHYLITRFNLRNAKWHATKNKETILTDEWLGHRLSLFHDFCLPSVVGQTNKNFKWLIYFDTETPEKFKGEIQALLNDSPFVEHFYIDGMLEFIPSVRNYIASDSKGVPYIITSRIDNDDCISKQYIDAVQGKFNRQDFLALDCVNGYTLQIKPQCMLGKKEHVFNPFISLIEKNENPVTVWVNNHAAWKKEPNVLQVKEPRLWLSIIHDKNVVNKFDGYDNVSWPGISKEFSIGNDVYERISKELIPYGQWKFLSIKNKINVKITAQSKMLKKAVGFYKKQ
ncbi:MAG: glycosyltransferase [Bacteroidales bacterium]